MWAPGSVRWRALRWKRSEVSIFSSVRHRTDATGRRCQYQTQISKNSNDETAKTYCKLDAHPCRRQKLCFKQPGGNQLCFCLGSARLPARMRNLESNTCGRESTVGSEHVCPVCGFSVIRIPRRKLDRFYSLFFPVRRYRCESFHCQWQGNIGELPGGDTKGTVSQL